MIKKNKFLQGQLWRQKLEFREAHQQSLTEMGRITEIPEFYLRYDRETKIHQGSEHYIGNFQAEYRNYKMK